MSSTSEVVHSTNANSIHAADRRFDTAVRGGKLLLCKSNIELKANGKMLLTSINTACRRLAKLLALGEQAF